MLGLLPRSSGRAEASTLLLLTFCGAGISSPVGNPPSASGLPQRPRVTSFASGLSQRPRVTSLAAGPLRPPFWKPRGNPPRLNRPPSLACGPSFVHFFSPVAPQDSQGSCRRLPAGFLTSVTASIGVAAVLIRAAALPPFKGTNGCGGILFL